MINEFKRMWKEVIVACFGLCRIWSMRAYSQLPQLVKCCGRPVVKFVTYDKELVMYQ